MKTILAGSFLFLAITAKSQFITTVAGNGISNYSGNGIPATQATMRGPHQVTFDGNGNYYFCDETNNVVRKVDANGIITTVAGNAVGAGMGQGSFTGDGGQATAAGLYYPIKTIFDTLGNMYIADCVNHRIRKVDVNGVITTFAGNGNAWNSGDGGTALSAGIRNPSYIKFDQSWNMYVISSNGNCIRKINPQGIISTIAGTGSIGYSGDGGPATAAKLYYPSSLVIDAVGNIIFSDRWNNRIRKIDAMGIITTIAGTGLPGYNGDGIPALSAQLNYPFSLTLDSLGNLYMADMSNHRVRRISTSGIITTIAGNGLMGYTGDGGLADTTRLKNPTGVEFDNAGNLYISDSGNSRIRKVEHAIITEINKNDDKSALIIYPNPFTNVVTIKSVSVPEQIDVFNSLGERVFTTSAKSLTTKIDLSQLSAGIYILKLKNKTSRLVKVD
jgi:sugar lactone lactonase YvrE